MLWRNARVPTLQHTAQAHQPSQPAHHVLSKFSKSFKAAAAVACGEDAPPCTHNSPISAVIVGSGEMAYLLYQGQVGIGDYLFSFLLPTALGNILGGTGVFTLLVYGQVNNELN